MSEPSQPPSPINPETTKDSKPPKVFKTSDIGPQFLPPLVGHKVNVRLLQGQPITGVLAGFNKYELKIEVGKRTLIIYKHAVAIIEAVP